MSDRTAALWETMHGDLHGFLRSRLPDDDTADDLLQETFLRIHENLDRLEDCERITGWVYRIARNLVHDHYRNGGRADIVSPAELDRIAGEERSDEDENRNREILSWLPLAIEALPETYRDAVRLFELERRSQKEIAERLGISLTAAKSRVRRGRALLVEQIHGCCRFELDARGNVLDYEPRRPSCGCD